MNKLFQRIFFSNNTTPALNATNMNAISKGLSDVDDRVIDLADDVMTTVPQIAAYLAQAQDLVEALELMTANPPYIGANGHWYVWDTDTSQYVDSGVDASISVQIADITMLNYGTAPYVTNTGTDTDPVFHLFIPKAAGVSSVTKTSTSGLVDTYTITFEDGTTGTFTVTNGENGHVIYNGSGTAMAQRSKLKFGGGLKVTDDTDTTVVTDGVWTTPVACLTGDTTVTITDANITTGSTVIPYSETSSGKPVGYSSIAVTTGQAVITFSSALTEGASIKLNIL